MIKIPEYRLKNSHKTTFSLKSNSSIAFIIVYFGKWPPWIAGFLRSCASNDDINWLIFTDCRVEFETPKNVRLVKMTLDEARRLASAKLGFEVALRNSRKLCDLKPAYGLIFEDFLELYDFWGFCDIDIVWGNIRSFWPDELLRNYDIITTRKNLIAGHMCILRNLSEFRLLFLDYAEIQNVYMNCGYCGYDERIFSEQVAQQAESGLARVYWPRFMVNFHTPVGSLPSYLSPMDQYRWKDGRLFSDCEGGREILYLHFMNWKHSLKWCGLKNQFEEREFYICFSHIGSKSAKPPIGYRLQSRIRTLRTPRLYSLYAKRAVRRILDRWILLWFRKYMR